MGTGASEPPGGLIASTLIGEVVLGVQVLDEPPGGLEREERPTQIRLEGVRLLAQQGLVRERGREEFPEDSVYVDRALPVVLIERNVNKARAGEGDFLRPSSAVRVRRVTLSSVVTVWPRW